MSSIEHYQKLKRNVFVIPSRPLLYTPPDSPIHATVEVSDFLRISWSLLNTSAPSSRASASIFRTWAERVRVVGDHVECSVSFGYVAIEPVRFEYCSGSNDQRLIT
ncbi:FeS assembly ATPase SufC [Striga asiatica]|uniref:FeS assembly ATPase SufC n=1 Tax=Striga asiatica TaxID=4170 RepID=A0A5A7QNR5_STRAF|nr:FeS assembly ATPase SufC [Striga asiatica]